MADLLAADVANELNKIPAGVWSKAFAEGRDMINFFGGIQPWPKGAGINDNGIIIPIYYSQNSSAVFYTEGGAVPASGHSTRKYFTQPFKRCWGRTGMDGLLDAISSYQGYGLGGDRMTLEFDDLISNLLNTINTSMPLDGTGTSGYEIQGMLYHISATGTWNTINKAGASYLQSYVDHNSGTDRDLTKALLDGILDTMRDTRKVTPTDAVTGAQAFHGYEELLADYRQDTGGGNDLFVRPNLLEGMKLTRLPIDTNNMYFLRKQDWGLYYLPQRVFSSDKLSSSEGPWNVEQVATGTDSRDYVLKMYLTLVCKNPWAQAALKDVQ